MQSRWNARSTVLAGLVGAEPRGLAPAAAEAPGAEPGELPLEQPDQVGREIHDPRLGGLGRLEPPLHPRALDPDPVRADIEVPRLEREGLAGAEAGLGEKMKERHVAVFAGAGGEEGVALLPAYRPDRLRALGGGQLVEARGPAPAELERRVDVENAVAGA